MTAGSRYFFQVKINNGFLIKIGVSRKDIVNDEVSVFVPILDDIIS